jgi:hypothetical protein
VSDGQNVYFAGVSSLYRLPISGGLAETLYTGPFAAQFGVAAGVVAWVPLAAGTRVPAGLTVEDADGIHSAVLPDGVVLSPSSTIVVDTKGNVFFQVDPSTGGRSHTWRWDPATNSAAEMPGVGMPEAGAGTNLYWADRGDLLWSNNIDAPAGGLYLTDISTGSARQIVDSSAAGFGGLVGLDASNVYGTGDICPKGACPFTVYGVGRGGGRPFVAYDSIDAYWVASPPQADDSGIYWIDWNTSGIYHATAAAGARATLIVHLGDSSPAIGSSIPADFAMDACNVYWLEFDPSHALHVMAKSK